MKILISNDDGFCAEGLLALVRELSKEHAVSVCAPMTQQSGVGRAMTLFDPLRAERVQLAGVAEEVTAFAVSGTPVDCVRIALGNLVERPDMVISGINHGPNISTDTLYSGTCAAAHEAALLGYPAIAVSNESFRPQYLSDTARVAARAVDFLSAHPLPAGTVLNVNTPDLPYAEYRGVRMARTGVSQYVLPFIACKDPGGHDYYWAPRARTEEPVAEGCDEYYIRQGYVTLTPLTLDNTDHALLGRMRGISFEL